MKPSHDVQLSRVQAQEFFMIDRQCRHMLVVVCVALSKAVNQFCVIDNYPAGIERVAGTCLFDALLDRLDSVAIT